MTIQELINEINYFAETADPQSEENLDVLFNVYCHMFLNKIGYIPEFKIVNEKGKVELK